jgi:hypothetical protein
MTIRVQVFLKRDSLQAESAWHWSIFAYADHQITTFDPEDPYVNYHKTIYPAQDIYGLEITTAAKLSKC